jgi:hypothetical protein
MIQRITKTSSPIKARIAGGLFLLLALTSATTEFFARGRSNSAVHLAAALIEVGCMLAVTFLLYDIFKPVMRRTSLSAMFVNFAAVVLELLRVQPRGVNIGMAFHGFYWLLLAALMFRSGFLPRTMSALPIVAGLSWFIFLVPGLDHSFTRGSLAVALIMEGLTMSWFLVAGVRPGRRSSPPLNPSTG